MVTIVNKFFLIKEYLLIFGFKMTMLTNIIVRIHSHFREDYSWYSLSVTIIGTNQAYLFIITRGFIVFYG